MQKGFGVLLRVKKLKEEAHLPTYQTEGSAGFDLRALLYESSNDFLRIQPNGYHLFHTGLAFEIPAGYFVQVSARSSVGIKGLALPQGVGIIDSDYRGEICIPMFNHSPHAVKVNDGDRIAQGILLVHKNALIQEVPELTPTSRGEGGFGSTGK